MKNLFKLKETLSRAKKTLFKTKKPFPSIWLMRFLVIAVIVLSILAAYYRETLRLEKKKCSQLNPAYTVEW